MTYIDLLHDRIQVLQKEFDELDKQRKTLETTFQTITTSKAYKVWQGLNALKKRVMNFDKAIFSAQTQPAYRQEEYMGSLFEKSYKKSSDYYPYHKNLSVDSQSTIKPIAFYFPQFHPFPENDLFWGKGFTEWANISKTVPLFVNHNQPRLPGELGFYDTRLNEVLRDQIRIAKNYGIHGFCFHHYWFMGRKVMRAPYNHILSDPTLDIPFCLHWANEPWTVRWDGLSKSGVLLDQIHTPEDDIAFIKDIEPALKDKRYIKIDGKPLLIIYRPSLFPDIKSTVMRWNKYCQEQGIGQLYLATMQTSFEGMVDPKQYGFDAAIEYPPHNTPLDDIKDTMQLFYPTFNGHVFDYKQALQNTIKKSTPPYTWFRGVLPDWDCSPRRLNSDIMVNSNPTLYQAWLSSHCKYTKQHRIDNERYIFINAWNEWAEGAYLEPDRKWGFNYLQSTYNALKHFDRRIAVVAHIFHEDLLDEFINYFSNIPQIFDLYISTKPSAVSLIRKKCEVLSLAHKIDVRATVNKGRDIGPLLVEFKDVYRDYDYVCFVHSKKNQMYQNQSEKWRKYLLDNLMGNSDTVNSIWDQFRKDSKLGFVYPAPFPPIKSMMVWGSNLNKATKLAFKLQIKLNKQIVPEYPAGSMFWFRPHALQPLLNLHLGYDDFEPGSERMNDGTLAHAIERLFCLVVHKAGYRSTQVRYKPHKAELLAPSSPMVTNYRKVLINKPKIAVALHLYYPDLIPEIIDFLKHIPLDFDLWITTNKESSKVVKDAFKTAYDNGKIHIEICDNRGFDIGPFVSTLIKKLEVYDYVLKIHGKKSLYNPGHANWRKYLFSHLFGSEEVVETILTYFEENKDLGLVFPTTYPGVQKYNQEDPWRANWLKGRELGERMGIHMVKERQVMFPAGSMFWFRPEALKPLSDLNLALSDFEPGGKMLDGTYAHAIERLFSLIAKQGGYSSREVNFEN
jgi:lipopolysaccharide biosynthesis protein